MNPPLSPLFKYHYTPFSHSFTSIWFFGSSEVDFDNFFLPFATRIKSSSSYDYLTFHSYSYFLTLPLAKGTKEDMVSSFCIHNLTAIFWKCLGDFFIIVSSLIWSTDRKCMCATYTRLSLYDDLLNHNIFLLITFFSRVCFYFIVYLSFFEKNQKTNVCLLSGMLTSTLLMDRNNPCHLQKYKKLRRRQVNFFPNFIATRHVVVICFTLSIHSLTLLSLNYLGSLW